MLIQKESEISWRKKCDKIELAELLKRDVIIKLGSHVTDIGDDHCVGDHSLSKILCELSS